MAELSKREKMERKDPLVQLFALDLGENLRACRKNKGWSQEALAHNMKTGHARISYIESGLVNARLSDIVGLARILQVEPSELLDLSAYKLDDYPEQPPNNHAQP